MRDLGIVDKDYRCAHFDLETGIERFRAEIDWAGFTDWQIVEAFRCWVKENRPRGVGRADERGKRKGAGLYAQLKCVGILRLMNAIPFTRIQTRHPDAWKRYRSMDWPRARQNAGRTFCQLFFFLPETDRPLHWPRASARSRWADNPGDFLPIWGKTFGAKRKAACHGVNVMPALNSPCLSWVEFDSGTMWLTFRSGRNYTLHGVPEHHYYGLLNASSPGWYFNTFLKGNY